MYAFTYGKLLCTTVRCIRYTDVHRQTISHVPRTNWHKWLFVKWNAMSIGLNSLTCLVCTTVEWTRHRVCIDSTSCYNRIAGQLACKLHLWLLNLIWWLHGWNPTNPEFIYFGSVNKNVYYIYIENMYKVCLFRKMIKVMNISAYFTYIRYTLLCMRLYIIVFYFLFKKKLNHDFQL